MLHTLPARELSSRINGVLPHFLSVEPILSFCSRFEHEICAMVESVAALQHKLTIGTR
jgi:hypothetical protein